MKNNPSRKISRLQFRNLLNSTWAKAANIENGINGFKASGIIPLNHDMIRLCLTEEIKIQKLN